MSEIPGFTPEEETQDSLNKERSEYIVNLMRSGDADFDEQGRLIFSEEAILGAQAEMNVDMQIQEQEVYMGERVGAFDADIHEARTFSYDEIIEIICEAENIDAQDLELGVIILAPSALDQESILCVNFYYSPKPNVRQVYQFELRCKFKLTDATGEIRQEVQEETVIDKWVEDREKMIEDKKSLLEESSGLRETEPVTDSVGDSYDTIALFEPNQNKWLFGERLVEYYDSFKKDTDDDDRKGDGIF